MCQCFFFDEWQQQRRCNQPENAFYSLHEITVGARNTFLILGLNIIQTLTSLISSSIFFSFPNIGDRPTEIQIWITGSQQKRYSWSLKSPLCSSSREVLHLNSVTSSHQGATALAKEATLVLYHSATARSDWTFSGCCVEAATQQNTFTVMN